MAVFFALFLTFVHNVKEMSKIGMIKLHKVSIFLFLNGL